MKQNQNLKVPLLSFNSARKSRQHTNPQQNTPHQTQMSPSNKSDTFYIDRKSKPIDTDKTVIKSKSPSLRQIDDLTEKLNKAQAIQKSLRQQMKQIHKENTELTIANQSLRTELFIFQQQLSKTKEFDMAIRELEEESLEAQKTIIDLQNVIKSNNEFKRVQQEAKKKNMVMLSEMEHLNIQLSEVFQMEKSRCNQLTQKLLKYQQNEKKNRNKIKELELKLQQKSQRESCMSWSRVTERENQKIKILMNINQRQKGEIADLYSVIEQRSKGSGTIPSKQLQMSKNRILELQTEIAVLKKQNESLKSTTPKQLQNSLIPELQKQISQLNEKVFNYNTQNNELNEELDQFYTRNRQLEEVNVSLTNQCRELDEKIIKYMKQVAALAENVRVLEGIKEEYERLDEQKVQIQERLEQTMSQLAESKRKNKQLLSYNEELRIDGQRSKGQIIEMMVELEELKSIRQQHPPKNNLLNKDEISLSRNIKERNILLFSNFYKFKELVLNELRIMSLQLVVRQNQQRNEESQQLIIDLRRRLDKLLLDI